MTPAPGRGSLVEGEFVFTAEDFRQIAQTLHSHAGIALNEGKAALVYSRLAKRLRTLGLRSFREYCGLIEGADGVDERQAMMAALTTNVTRFYREPHHFDDLRDRVMPMRAERARAGERVPLTSTRARFSSLPSRRSGCAGTSGLRRSVIRLSTRVLAGSRSNVRSTVSIQNAGAW